VADLAHDLAHDNSSLTAKIGDHAEFCAVEVVVDE
jgi:hypothetical protein